MSGTGDVTRRDDTVEPSGDQAAAIVDGLGAVPSHGDAQPTAYDHPDDSDDVAAEGTMPDAPLDDDTLTEEGAP